MISPALNAGYETQQLLDLVFTIGTYNLVSMVLNSWGVQLDEGLEAFSADVTKGPSFSRSQRHRRTPMVSTREHSKRTVTSPRIYAAVTGFIGLAVLVSGSFAGSVTSRLLVRSDPVVTSNNIMYTNSFLIVTHLSELALLVWLLTKGVNTEHWNERTLAGAAV